MNEEWRPIDGWPYEISESGRVRRTTTSSNHKAGKELKPRKHCSGRVCYSLLRGGRETTGYIFAHILVCGAWNGKKPSIKHEVAHWDGNHLNNHYTNLRWATHKENAQDRFRHSTTPLGSNNPYSKLNEEEVILIRHIKKKHNWSNRKIANIIGMSCGGVRDIISRKNWSHLEAA